MKVLYFAFGLFLSGILNAQTTLEFSRVVLVGATTDTVPPGKVWKVENPIPSTGMTKGTASYTSTPSLTSNWSMIIDGTTIPLSEVKESGATGYSSGSTVWAFSGINTDFFPFWLPAGPTIAASSGLKYISVLEFTIKP